MWVPREHLWLDQELPRARPRGHGTGVLHFAYGKAGHLPGSPGGILRPGKFGAETITRHGVLALCFPSPPSSSGQHSREHGRAATPTRSPG